MSSAVVVGDTPTLTLTVEDVTIGTPLTHDSTQTESNPILISGAAKSSDQSTVELSENTVPADRSRYTPLAVWLKEKSASQHQLSLSFEEVEVIIKTSLPASARRHRSWWANDSVSHPQSQQWLNAGWKVSAIDIRTEQVVFTRTQAHELTVHSLFQCSSCRVE